VIKELECFVGVLPVGLLDDVERVIKERKLSGSGLKRFVDKVVEEYEFSRVTPGESVGVICASSISEPATQMTLNAFHLAGVSEEISLTTGLPRIIELVDGRKAIKTPVMNVFLKAPFSSGKDIKDVAVSLKETKLVEVARNISIDVSNSRIDVEVDPGRMELFGIDREEMVERLSSGVKKVEVDFKGGVVSFSVLSSLDLNSLYKLKNDIKGACVKGVKGISHVLPIKRGDEFFISTTGSNLKEVLGLDFVDSSRTITNDIYELCSVFGIEAARHHIINEIKAEIVDNQGLALDMRHLLLVADTICFSGAIKGMNRYGVIKEKSSTLVKASFETPIKHLTSASVTGVEDEVVGVVDNIMLNQHIMMGTGFPELRSKVGVNSGVRKGGVKVSSKKEKDGVVDGGVSVDE